MKNKGFWDEEIQTLREDINNLSDREREEGKEQLTVLLKALGAKDEMIRVFEKAVEPTSPTPFAAKVRELAKLDAEFKSALAECGNDSQRQQELKQMYDKERTRIVGG